MTHDSPTSVNPCASGDREETVELQTEVRAGPHPLGTLVLAVLLLLGGLGVGAQRVFMLVRAFSIADNVVIHSRYYVVLTRNAATVISCIVAAVALLAGRRMGWWMALIHCYWRLSCQTILPIMGTLFAKARDEVVARGTGVMQRAVTAGILFSLMVLYLMKKNVTTFFGVDPSRRLLANVVILGLSVLLAFGLDVWWAVLRWKPEVLDVR